MITIFLLVTLLQPHQNEWWQNVPYGVEPCIERIG